MNTKQLESFFRLIGTKIKSFDVKNDFVTAGSDLSEKIKTDVSYVVAIPDVVDKIWFSTLTLTVKGRCNIRDIGKFSFSLVIEGGFQAPQDLPREKFIHMLKVNGSASLYSIARGFITSTTSQVFSGGNLVLPLIDMVKLTELQDKNNDAN